MAQLQVLGQLYWPEAERADFHVWILYIKLIINKIN